MPIHAPVDVNAPPGSFGGEPGTRWTNDTGKIVYQFICNFRHSCGRCMQYHHRIGPWWPIPLHPGCCCMQRPVPPGKTAAPFADFLDELADLPPSQQAIAVGASNWKLIRAGVVEWGDVVTRGRIRGFAEVVEKYKLKAADLERAGIRGRMARAALDAANSPATAAANAAKKSAYAKLVAHGLTDAQIRAAVAERVKAKIGMGGAPPGGPTSFPPPGGAPVPPVATKKPRKPRPPKAPPNPPGVHAAATAWPTGTDPALPERVEHEAFIRGEQANAVARLAADAGMGEDAYRAAIRAKLKEAVAAGDAYIRVDSGTLPKVIESGGFRNQFQTGVTRGSLDYEGRRNCEADLMGVPQSAPGEARPIYGYLSAPGFGQAHAEHAAESYGVAVVRLKPSIKARATLTVSDSLSFHDRIAASPALDPSEHSFALQSHAMPRISGAILGAEGDDLHATLTRSAGYVELQFFGGVKVSDVAEVGLIGPPGPKLRTQLEKAGIPWKIIRSADD